MEKRIYSFSDRCPHCKYPRTPDDHDPRIVCLPCRRWFFNVRRTPFAAFLHWLFIAED